MHLPQIQCEEFHVAFNLPNPDQPDLNVKDASFRLKLIAEELAESYDALYELAHGDPIPYVDLLCDLQYFISGAAVSMGIDLQPFFDEVHWANMTKLSEDGKPHYREDGKVQKPEGWEPADLYKVWETHYGTI